MPVPRLGGNGVVVESLLPSEEGKGGRSTTL